MKKPKLTTSGLIESHNSSPYRTVKVLGNSYKITTKFKEKIKVPKRSRKQNKEVFASIQEILNRENDCEIE